MPTLTSSLIPVLGAQPAAPLELTAERCAELLDVLAGLPDPRKRRGRRHGIVMAVAVCAVLSGARSFAAISEWIADVPTAVLSALRVRCGPLTGVWLPPAESTLRRVLTRIDAAVLDRLVGAWLSGCVPPQGARRWRGLAVDDKTLRGSGHHDRAKVRLLAVMDHAAGTVLAQVEVGDKTNEISRFVPLLDPLDMAGTVITADALHTHREHADWLVGVEHAAYILVVKRNQPTLYRQLKTLPWRHVPIQDEPHDRGHGRHEIRRLQVVSTDRLDFPHAVQAIRLTRRARDQKTQTWRTVTVYAITSLTATQARPDELADHIRGHWGIEAP